MLTIITFMYVTLYIVTFMYSFDSSDFRAKLKLYRELNIFVQDRDVLLTSKTTAAKKITRKKTLSDASARYMIL